MRRVRAKKQTREMIGQKTGGITWRERGVKETRKWRGPGKGQEERKEAMKERNGKQRAGGRGRGERPRLAAKNAQGREEVETGEKQQPRDGQRRDALLLRGTQPPPPRPRQFSTRTASSAPPPTDFRLWHTLRTPTVYGGHPNLSPTQFRDSRLPLEGQISTGIAKESFLSARRVERSEESPAEKYGATMTTRGNDRKTDSAATIITVSRARVARLLRTNIGNNSFDPSLNALRERKERKKERRKRVGVTAIKPLATVASTNTRYEEKPLLRRIIVQLLPKTLAIDLRPNRDSELCVTDLQFAFDSALKLFARYIMREIRCSGIGLLLLTLLHLSHRAAAAGSSSDYYTAAVVEFSPTYRKNDASATLRANTDAYIEYMQEASKRSADIIVFPEDALTSLHMPGRSGMDAWATVVPSPRQEYVPCTSTTIEGISQPLKRLSCAARLHRIYLVVNIAEKELPHEDEEGAEGARKRIAPHYYNTNVVFDRTGKVIARYRKVNLYNEAGFDRTETPEVVTFDTDFGVKFGTFTCFDILFSVPALNLTRQLGISDIVFTTAWFSELPFLTAIQTQYGWSYGEDANLLAAGYHNPDIGSAGSGIYLGRNGIANVTMVRYPEHRLLISRVPKTTASRRLKQKQEQEQEQEQEQKQDREGRRNLIPNKVYEWKEALAGTYECTRTDSDVDWIRLLHDNVASFHSVPLNASMSDTICHDNFCCDFHVRKTDDDRSSSVNYRAVIYNGVRIYGTVVQAGIRLCGVLQCSNDTIHSCGIASNANTVFTALSIAARVDDRSKVLAMPSVLDSSLIPFEHWRYAEHRRANRTTLTLLLKKPTTNLVTFGIYVRDFTKDVWNQSI